MFGRDLTTGPIPALSWSLAWPVMLSLFFQTLYQLVDAFWVSRISEDALAAVTVSQVTLFLMTSLSLGITVGSGVLLAVCVGRDDIPAAERVLGQSFLLNLLAGLLFTALALWQRHSLLVLSGAVGEILPLALDYFTLLAAGSVLSFLFFAVIFGFNSQGDNSTLAWLYALSTVLNAVLDPVLIFGYLGLPALGIRGAAVATIISQALLLAAGVTLLKVLPLPVRFRFRNLVLNPGAVLKVLAIGLPAAFANLLSPLRLAVLSILVARWFLEPGVAGVAVGYRIEFFTFLPALGYATAVLALVGQNLGAGKLERVGRSWRAAMVSAFAAGTLLGVAAALARGPAAALFTDDPVVTSYARSYLATIPLTFGAVSATVVAISALHALGRPWQGLAVAVARVVLMVAAMLLAAGGLAGHPDPGALWVAIVAANVTTCASAYLLLRRTFGKLRRDTMIKTAGGPHGAPAGLQGAD